MTAEFALGRVEPDGAASIFASCHEPAFARSAAQLDALHLAIHAHELDARGLGADPKIARGILEKINDTAALEAGRVVLIEDGKLRSVKTDQAVERPQPKVTVARLCDCDRGVLGKGVLGLP